MSYSPVLSPASEVALEVEVEGEADAEAEAEVEVEGADRQKHVVPTEQYFRSSAKRCVTRVRTEFLQSSTFQASGK